MIQLRSRALVILVMVGALLTTVVAPAGAAEVTDTRPTDVASTDVAPTDVRPDIRPDIEVLRLRCRGVLNADGLPEVRCKWTAPTVDSAHVVALQRNDGSGFESIWRTANVERSRYVDTAVEAGRRYRYRVRVFDANKHLVAASRSNGAGVPIPPIHVLEIGCEAGVIHTTPTDVAARDAAITDELPPHKVVECKWTGTENVRAYQLWRLVNRGHRELVGTYDNETFNAKDRPGDDALVVKYAVLALDADGEIIGRSRPTTVRFPGIR
jgi:hypothetical protein